MEIRYHKIFKKRFKRLDDKLKKKTIQAIECFSENPFDKKLRNHALKGKLKGQRAFYVTSNVRVVYLEFDDYVVVVMLDVGTHNQVYR